MKEQQEVQRTSHSSSHSLATTSLLYTLKRGDSDNKNFNNLSRQKADSNVFKNSDRAHSLLNHNTITVLRPDTFRPKDE